MYRLQADVISLTAAVGACASAMRWEVVMDLLAQHDGNEATYHASVPWYQTKEDDIIITCPDIMCSVFLNDDLIIIPWHIRLTLQGCCLPASCSVGACSLPSQSLSEHASHCAWVKKEAA